MFFTFLGEWAANSRAAERRQHFATQWPDVSVQAILASRRTSLCQRIYGNFHRGRSEVREDHARTRDPSRSRNHGDADGREDAKRPADKSSDNSICDNHSATTTTAFDIYHITTTACACRHTRRCLKAGIRRTSANYRDATDRTAGRGVGPSEAGLAWQSSYQESPQSTACAYDQHHGQWTESRSANCLSTSRQFESYTHDRGGSAR